MADGKITIEVEVNGQKLSSLSADLKRIESDAKRSGEGFKQASDKIKESGDKAKSSGQGFKEAGDKAKSASETAKAGGDGFKQAGDRAKNAGDVAKGAGSGFDEAGNKAKDSGEKAKQGASGFDKIKESIKNFSVGAVGFKLASSAMDLVSASLDKAINRFDTLERYPKVMKSLGFSAKDVANSTKELSDGIDGLPTTLDDVVKTTQKLTSMTGDLKTSTKLTLALNNAFLASGASTEDASRGLQQFSQMLSAGKVDMQSWKTLQETMPYALQKTAESFGFAGESAQKDFYSALLNGEITFKQFSKRLIELNQGTNGFAEMAKKNSEGIQTSWNNIINAFAKGIANVMKAFDDLSKAITGKSIAKNLDGLKAGVNGFFKFVTDGIRGLIPIVQSVNNVLGALKPVFDALIPVITGAVAGALAFKGAMLALAIIDGVKNWVSGLIQSLVTFSSTALVAEGSTSALGVALGGLTGGVTLVVGAVIGLVSWLSRETDEQKKAREASEKHKESIKKLNDEVTQGKERYEDHRREIKATADENEKLVRKIEELSAVQKKTASQKKELAAATQTLNNNVSGLNIVYDKATGSINMTADAIRRQIEVTKQSAEAEAANQRLVEIAKQKLEVEDKIADVKSKLKDAEERLGESASNSTIKEVALQKVREEAGKQLSDLEGSLKSLESQYEETSNTAVKSAEASTQAVEDASGRQILTWNTLNESQRKLVEDMRSQYETMRNEVQNAFQAIEQQAVVSVDQMTANLQKNIEYVDKWAGNLETLARRGLDQGLIEQLRQAGPKAAEQTQALVEASDEQLGNLNQKWSEAGDKAKEGFLRGINAAGVELAPEVQAMVTAIGDEFRKALQDAGFDVKAREIPEKVGEGITSNIAAAAQAMSGIAESAKQGFNGVPEEARNSGAQVSGQYAQGITDNQGVAQGAGELLKSASLGALDGIFGDAQTKGSELGSGLSSGVSGGIEAVQGAANALKAGAVTSVAGMASEGQAKGSEFGGGIASGIGIGQQLAVGAASVMNIAISAQFLAMASDGQSKGSQFGSGVGNGISSTQGIVTGASNALKETVNASVSSLGRDGRKAGSDFGSGATDGIQSHQGSAHSAGSSLRDNATNGMQGGYNSAYGAGMSIGEGLTAGIYAMAGSVANAAASIAYGAVSAARSALSINSPSKVFRDKIGRAIPEGWALGIDKYSWYVDNSMDDLAKNTIDASAKFVSGFGLNIPKSAEIASGLNASLAYRFGGGSAGVSNSTSNVTNNYTLNATGQGNNDFFTPDNMRRLIRELAYYTRQERGRMI
ncbi:tape measure protein [Streptococcus gordonii]|uniref:tape measure protein n=1 Tax=Streptococcus gordonii TaxID=1302 RepID=UPI000779ACC8|nr:tape measure protein [Streptococcus gordonii]QBX25252.1 tail length tape-measure protein [Streptococcus phage Javan246]